MNKSTFISYRSSDDTDLPINLDNYLRSENIDSFCDRNNSMNYAPLRQALPEEVKRRDNFVILFTLESLKSLIEFRRNRTGKEDYVDTELRAALEHLSNIIPVFIDPGNNQEELLRLYEELFEDDLNLGGVYHYVCRTGGMSDKELFEKIKVCLSDRVQVPHTDLSGLYWVGSRLSDVSEYGNFKGYVVFFGERSDEKHYVMCPSDSGRRVDHNDASDIAQDDFIKKSICDILDKDPDAKFMFYNPSTIYRLKIDEKFGIEHFVCLNEKNILDSVNNKQSFRILMDGAIPLLPVIERTRADCDYDDLLEAKKNGAFIDRNYYGMPVPDIQYDKDLQFIVQAPISSGGAGTFILNKNNADYLRSSLDPRAKYLASIYHTKNIAVNMHILIDSKNIICLPASIQLEREVTGENKLLYKGADFVAYEKIELRLQNQFKAQAKKVAEVLQKAGYRGVFGVDAIIHDGRVNILEVNGRFQASSELINREFKRHGYKTLQELNIDAFSEHGICEDDINRCMSIHVPFSNFTFSYEGQAMHDSRIFKRASELAALNSKTSAVAAVQADGYDPDSEKLYNAQAYLYRIVFHKNIASVNEDGAVLIHENICTPEKWLTKKIFAKEKLAVKLALMIQGINIERGIRESLREATNNAVDLQFGSGKNLMIVNSPTNIRYVEFSPFDLKRSQKYPGKFCVCYYGQELIDNVGVFPADKNQKMGPTKTAHTYSEIAYLSTDRLRVHLTNACLYKQSGQGCQFCNIEINSNPNPITAEDIEEVVEKYIADKSEADAAGETVTLRHFLIGGQSLKGCDSLLIDTAKILSKYHMPIYAMTLPLKEATVRTLVSCGVTEFAYNIEVFNDKCRKKYMPGKSQYSVEDYLSALTMTRKVLNAACYRPEKKIVRSMVIVGLEPYEDMVNGIKMLIENNIEPMLSVFRPLPGTPLAYLNAPPIRMVYELFYTISTCLYEKNHKSSRNLSKLGPECVCCQNNTVSLPWKIQEGVATQLEWIVDPEQAVF